MIKLLIADDHTLFREGIKQILATTQDIKVEAETGNGLDVLEKVKNNNYDVILLDISMPGMHGLDVLKQIRKGKPKLPILMLSMYSEEQYAIRAIRAGASGYLTKESAPDELIIAIRQVSVGKRYITSSLADKLASEVEMTTNKRPHKILTDHEYQIMNMLVSGKKTGEIAKELCLSPKTISTYRVRILKKMGLKTTAQLIHYAAQNQLIC